MTDFDITQKSKSPKASIYERFFWWMIIVIIVLLILFLYSCLISAS